MILMGPYEPQDSGKSQGLGEFYNGRSPEEHARLLVEESRGYNGYILGGWSAPDDATIAYGGKNIDVLVEYNKLAAVYTYVWVFQDGAPSMQQIPDRPFKRAWLRRNWLWFLAGAVVLAGGGALVWQRRHAP